MSEPATYQTAGGATVTLDFIINAFNQPTHLFDCDGCNGRCGFKTVEQAEAGAEKHAARCTDKPGGGVK
jgi:hypothetical protein